jgi:two-component system, chemotaxis family, protein-glutamate methylesterase/glutaminase
MPNPPHLRRDLIVIGGSAGALEALKILLAELPKNLAASILLVVHVPPDYPSILPEILSRTGPLHAFNPSDREALKPGKVYVAKPDFHMLVEDGHVLLTRGPKENWHRPAIDPLFRSAARSYGPRVIGIVLSGQLDDGSAGLMAIKLRGGTTIVQDPGDAIAPQMPYNAIHYAEPDYVVPVSEMPALLIRLLKEQVQLVPQPAEVGMHDEIHDEARQANLEEQRSEPNGKPSVFACPECHGVMWELEESGLLRFRCRVGHAFTADSLNLAMSEATEDALWAAMRALEERSALLRRVAPRSAPSLNGQFEEEADAMNRHADQIRKMLVQTEHFARLNNGDVSASSGIGRRGAKKVQQESREQETKGDVA